MKRACKHDEVADRYNCGLGLDGYVSNGNRSMNLVSVRKTGRL